MENTFSGVIEAFNTLKTKFQAGDISRQEFIDEMKKLRIKDDQGRFWMIGAQTGKWYFFDGKDWVQADPPSLKEKKAICIYCGFENKLEAEVCARCGGNIGEGPALCPKCGSKLQKPFMNCPQCGTGQAVEVSPPGAKPSGSKTGVPIAEWRGAFVLRSVHPTSMFFFGAILGLLVGIIGGAFTGATGYFSKSLTFLPTGLANLQGKLLGGAVFGLLGGVLGFLAIGYLAFLWAVIMNFILSLTGGLKFQVHPVSKKRKKTLVYEESDYREDDSETRD
jgi:hypothetical protein